MIDTVHVYVENTVKFLRSMHFNWGAQINCRCPINISLKITSLYSYCFVEHS